MRLATVWTMLLAFLLCAERASAKENFSGFERPEATRGAVLRPSELTANSTVTFGCKVFPKFAIITVHDPGLIGLDRIAIRPRTKGANVDQLCAHKGFRGKELEIDAGDNFLGVVGNFVFLDDPDGFGGKEFFRIHDATTGQKLYQGEYEISESFRVVRRGKRVSLEYFHHLDVTCKPTIDGAGCWRRLFETNKIPASVKIQQPDCKSAFLRGRSPMDNNALISVPARIDDLAKPVLTFLSGRATCDPSP